MGTDIECIVNNRNLFVINGQPVNKNSPITLTVFDVKNPRTTGTGVTNYFELWHMNDSMSAKAKNRFVNGVSITAYPANMILKRVLLNTHEIFTVGEYQF